MLFKLLFAPVTAPLAGLRFILSQVQTVADRQLMDVDSIREELLLLQYQLDEGTVTEDEYRVREADIMARLRTAREYQLRGGR